MCKYCGEKTVGPFCIDGGKTIKGKMTKSLCYEDYREGALLDAKLGVQTPQLLDFIEYGDAYKEWTKGI